MGRCPRKDVLAGLMVAITALPLALGLGAASGLGPQAGLASAVVAGGLAALLGGSNLQVSGPTGVLTVVIAPVVHRFGARGALTVGLMAGLLVIALALSRVSGCLRYLPAPVVKGFTIGSAAVIILQQIPPGLGIAVRPRGTVIEAAVRSIAHPNWVAVALCSAVVVARLVGGRLLPNVPSALVAVVGGTVLVRVVGLSLPRIGHVPSSLPYPSLGFLDFRSMPVLLPSAVTVAAVVALEALITAAAADAMSDGEPHDGDRELFGQGVANLAAPLFGGLAATGTVVRTASNVRQGACSRLAALVHAVALGVLAFTAAPLVATVPVCALAGVLIATATRMVDVRSLRALARADRGQAAVVAVTAVVTLAFGLVAAVTAGLVLAAGLALRAVVRSACVRREPDGRSFAVYRVEGPLLFASAARLLRPLMRCQTGVVVLRMARVTAVDATGILALRDTVAALAKRGTLVLVCGISDQHLPPMDALGVLDELRTTGRLFTTDAEADAFARAELDLPRVGSSSRAEPHYP
ncbi:SulP family inorganic anion transporter [Streptomyces silvisoli]|uniref:SulP family inorganic anion transporter n=1 Tax=Streptomyces silvisoli TaxID=3034235 RepID=A0ABT5ZL54_9ACTN|nr:SulP family inorganic anion transporter [Streptomyces silvisoli]MDF3290555.1 SulP family inorganic anion transporter [Streptomyces silvisoli]